MKLKWYQIFWAMRVTLFFAVILLAGYMIGNHFPLPDPATENILEGAASVNQNLLPVGEGQTSANDVKSPTEGPPTLPPLPFTPHPYVVFFNPQTSAIGYNDNKGVFHQLVWIDQRVMRVVLVEDLL